MELNDREIDLQRDAPTLAAIGKEVPFTVPAEYFDKSSRIISSMANIESLCGGDNNGFTTPVNYFAELPSAIEGRIALQNLKTAIPTDGFALPDGYFESLSARISLKIESSPKQESRVIRLATSWISYAAAACITVMIATGIYFNSDSYQFNKQLSEVPDQEIINYLQVHSTAGDTPFIMENINPEELEHVTPDVSAEDLEQYINSTTL